MEKIEYQNMITEAAAAAKEKDTISMIIKAVEAALKKNKIDAKISAYSNADYPSGRWSVSVTVRKPGNDLYYD